MFSLIYGYKENTFLEDLTKACLVSMATRDPDIIVFVIIHGNKLHDGGFFWVSLILKKEVAQGIKPP